MLKDCATVDLDDLPPEELPKHFSAVLKKITKDRIGGWSNEKLANFLGLFFLFQQKFGDICFPLLLL